MVLIGLSTRELGVGYVAEWCDARTGPTAHALTLTQERLSVYFIPVMPWRTVRATALCTATGTSKRVNHKDYTGVGEDPNAPIEELAARTNPRLHRTMTGVGPGDRAITGPSAPSQLSQVENQLVYHLEELSAPSRRRPLNVLTTVLFLSISAVAGMLIMMFAAQSRRGALFRSSDLDVIDYAIAVGAAAVLFAAIYLIARLVRRRSLFHAFMGTCAKLGVSREQVENAVRTARTRGAWLACLIAV